MFNYCFCVDLSAGKIAVFAVVGAMSCAWPATKVVDLNDIFFFLFPPLKTNDRMCGAPNAYCAQVDQTG